MTRPCFERIAAVTDMDELVLWLRAQIAEKRRRAMRTQWTAGGPPAVWTYDRSRFRVMSLDPGGNAQGVAHRRAGFGVGGEAYDDTLLDVDGEHMELNDPQAAVADCEAHTAILDLYEPVKAYDNLDESYEHATGRACGLGEAVRAIGLAYQHRPGYRQVWRPTGVL